VKYARNNWKNMILFMINNINYYLFIFITSILKK